MSELRTDIENLRNGDRVVLHPNEFNPIHKRPVKATVCDGYFLCDGTSPHLGPDYYWRDVLQFNHGFEMAGKP